MALSKLILAAFITSLLCCPALLAQPKLVPHKIILKTGKTFSLDLPSDLEIIPAAEGLKRVRFFAKAPDGRIFVNEIDGNIRVVTPTAASWLGAASRSR